MSFQPGAHGGVVTQQGFSRSLQNPRSAFRFQGDGRQAIGEHRRADAGGIVVSPEALDHLGRSDYPTRAHPRQTVSLGKPRGAQDTIVSTPETFGYRAIKFRAAVNFVGKNPSTYFLRGSHDCVTVLLSQNRTGRITRITNSH